MTATATRRRSHPPRRASRTEVGLNYVILLGFALISLWPILAVVAQAFGPAGPEDTEAGGPHLENFAIAWSQGRFSAYLLNSVIVSLTVVIISVVLSVLAGYAFGAMRFPGSTVLFYLFLFGIMVPTEAIVVPLFFDLRTLGLVDTLVAVAGPQIAQSIAFGTFWMRTYFRSADRAVTEAAIIDGAAPRQVLWQVQAPIARPAILTLIVLVFMWTWNEFLIPLVMSPTGGLRTAPLGLAFFSGQHVTNHALMGAAAVMVAAPVVILYLFAQRYFISGMTEGSLR